MKIMIMVAIALLSSAAWASSALAASTSMTFHDPAGRVSGKARSEDGITTFYDPADRVTGKARAEGGTTTYYDGSGRVIGRARSNRQ